MRSPLRKAYEQGREAVYYVEVERDGDRAIGTAFHIGDGIMLTARHVVERAKIRCVGAPQVDYSIKGPGAANNVTLLREPLFHPDDDEDIAILVTDVGTAPSIRLAPLTDEWVEEFPSVLDTTLIMGYPPIPFAKAPYLVATAGEVNAVISRYDRHGRLLYVVSTTPRGGFSGGPAVDEDGMAFGMCTEALVRDGHPVELGYTAVITVEPIWAALGHYRVTPRAARAEWSDDENELTMWEDFELRDRLRYLESFETAYEIDPAKEYARLLYQGTWVKIPKDPPPTWRPGDPPPPWPPGSTDEGEPATAWPFDPTAE